MEDEENYGLEQIHTDLLQALIQFDQICGENGIRYSIHGGTLLGAVRNHRFIPWDDDVDLSMMRADYKKLQDLCSSSKMSFELEENFGWTPRMVFRNSNGAVCLDILIWDYISSRKLAQKSKILLLRIYQGMLKTHIDYRKYNLFYRVLVFGTHAIGLLIPTKTKIRQYKFLSEHTFIGDKRCVHRANDNYQSINHIFDAEFIDDYGRIQLEGYEFMTIKNYHALLTRCYGADYLTPPPMERRVPEHESIRKELE